MDIYLLVLTALAGLAVLLMVLILLRLGEHTERIEELRRRVILLEEALRRLAIRPAAPAIALSSQETIPLPDVSSTASAAREARPASPGPQPVTAPVPAHPASEVTPIPASPGVKPRVDASPTPMRPTSPPSAHSAPAEVHPRPPVPSPINWENFLGVRLFAWTGGLLLFLAVAFFVKYSFERNLITPLMRVMLGYLTGFVLLVASFRLSRQRYSVTVHSLCAAAILIFYASTFAAHAYYGLLATVPAFGLMALITLAAFVMAVQLEAQVVAILGLLGGFLTPPILSTGVDQPFGLFGYIALLDAGLICVALRRRWNYLVALGGAGTVLMQAGWVSSFFAAEKFGVACVIFLGFAAFFAVAHLAACRFRRESSFSSAAAFGAAGAAFLFAFHVLFQPFDSVTSRPWGFFAYLFAIDLLILALAWIRPELRRAQFGSAALAFILIALWSHSWLSEPLINGILAVYLLFGLLHAVFPMVVERIRPSGQATGLANVFPPLVLVLILWPVVKFQTGGLFFWAIVLAAGILAAGLSAITGLLSALVVVVSLTVLITGIWISGLPPDLTCLPQMLAVVGGFTVFFFIASLAVGRRIISGDGRGADGSHAGPADSAINPPAQLPALSALLPFVLLLMMIMRLPLHDPSPVFGLALLLSFMVLGAVWRYGSESLSLVALAGSLLLEVTWHALRFEPGRAVIPLVWHLTFAAVFFAYPFFFRRRFASRMQPWVAAALAGPLHFFLVYAVVKRAWPNDFMGLIPAALAVPYLVVTWREARLIAPTESARNTRLALLGGAALFFITAIFPIQLSKQWLTLAWALEGTALVWFYHKVPHDGLRAVGGALLAASFARLALNPEVFAYHPREGWPVLNWWLYSYGIVTICLFAAAKLTAPPRHRIGEIALPPVFYSLGTALVFYLLNIEIADFFSEGAGLEFRLSANLAQDMTYSLAWGIFALILVGVGVIRKVVAARYAGLALLVGTLAKLFLHDIWRLGGLFRIGSLIGLAIVLISASFAYQRFLSTDAGTRGS